MKCNSLTMQLVLWHHQQLSKFHSYLTTTSWKKKKTSWKLLKEKLQNQRHSFCHKFYFLLIFLLLALKFKHNLCKPFIYNFFAHKSLCITSSKYFSYFLIQLKFQQYFPFSPGSLPCCYALVKSSSCYKEAGEEVREVS